MIYTNIFQRCKGWDCAYLKTVTSVDCITRLHPPVVTTIVYNLNHLVLWFPTGAPTHLTRTVDQRLVWGWASLAGGDPILSQTWFNASCSFLPLVGYRLCFVNPLMAEKYNCVAHCIIMHRFLLFFTNDKTAWWSSHGWWSVLLVPLQSRGTTWPGENTHSLCPQLVTCIAIHNPRDQYF